MNCIVCGNEMSEVEEAQRWANVEITPATSMMMAIFASADVGVCDNCRNAISIPSGYGRCILCGDIGLREAGEPGGWPFLCANCCN